MRINIIINKNARNDALADSFLQEFDKNNIAYKAHKVDSKIFAQTVNNYAKESDLLIVGGGDGSIRTGVAASIKNQVTLAVLPLGTLNHFAKELNLPNTPEDLIKALQANSTIYVDVACVNDNIFINNASIGLYVMLSKGRKYYSKFINKWISYIFGFFMACKNYKEYDITLDDKVKKIHVITPLLLVSNNIYTQEFPLNIQRDKFTEGVLGVYYFAFEKLSFRKVLNFFSTKKTKLCHFTFKSEVEINVAKQDAVSIALDGENLQLQQPLIFKTLPKSLHILTLAK